MVRKGRDKRHHGCLFLGVHNIPEQYFELLCRQDDPLLPHDVDAETVDGGEDGGVGFVLQGPRQDLKKVRARMRQLTYAI